MAIVFTKLLIPVDFTLNTEIAVKKAISLIGADKVVLHLLHVVQPHRPLPPWSPKPSSTSWRSE
ncbi:universal stress protein [Puia sp. P3]|uniref:universal stress protein n=1 Tax=Puia sp. P3 TaxID=3423952 RepID=UPI003D674687